MKITNEYVQIKLGDKTYTKKNLILNKYIERLFRSQIYADNSQRAEIINCFLKLDTPLEDITPESEFIADEDFDVIFFGGTRDRYEGENKFNNMTSKTNNTVVIRYKFNNDGMFEYNGDYFYNNEFGMFNGRKITAIGFGYGNNVYAVADVSNMNIIINQNESIMISRVDKYQSDAICYGFDYPLHLVNHSAHLDEKYTTGINPETGEEETTNEETRAQLYSVGLGNKLGLMETEHIIDENYEVSSHSIQLDFNETIKLGHYPNENLRLGFYPTLDNSKYLIVKYRLYRINGFGQVYYLDDYYTMSLPLDLTEYEGENKEIIFNLSLWRG